MKLKKDVACITSQELAEMLAEETYKVIEAQSGGKKDTRDVLITTLIGKLISTELYASLIVKPEKPFTKKDEYELTKKNYVQAKARMMHAVGAAFSAALSAFSGKQVDYYCEVKPTPEPTNAKYPC